MLKTKELIKAIGVGVAIGIAFACAQVDTAIKSIHFDLRKIGDSVYQAHARTGRWPAGISDLEGTAYLSMPYRKGFLENGHFVIIWHQDLDPNPAANRDRILAYDNGSLFSKLGWISVCRGDLTIQRMSFNEILAQKGSQ